MGSSLPAQLRHRRAQLRHGPAAMTITGRSFGATGEAARAARELCGFGEGDQSAYDGTTAVEELSIPRFPGHLH